MENKELNKALGKVYEEAQLLVNYGQEIDFEFPKGTLQKELMVYALAMATHSPAHARNAWCVIPNWPLELRVLFLKNIHQGLRVEFSEEIKTLGGIL